jgi:hypothetical protein
MSGTYMPAFTRKLFSPLTSTSVCSGWLVDTFVNIDDAEDSLCADHSDFRRNGRMMELVPRDIQRHIIYDGDNAHIEGFRMLFNYLNTEPAASDLRQLVVNYFNDHPYLQGHLHEFLSMSSFISIQGGYIT